MWHNRGTLLGLALALGSLPSHGQVAPDVLVSEMDYEVPDVELLRDDGRRVALRDEMNDGRAVVLNFIFTNCSSFCPLSSQTLGEFDRKLGDERRHVHLMSISIDPEQDTPARLREYARRFGAGPEWQHYTGSAKASVAAQQAFGAYRGDKMSHTPVTLIRAAHARSWYRVDGFITPQQLLDEYHHLSAEK
jgi:protein SCO1